MFCGKCGLSNKVEATITSHQRVECGCSISIADVEAKVSKILDEIQTVKGQISSGEGDKASWYEDLVEAYRRLGDILDSPNRVLLDTFEFHTSLLRHVHE